MTTSPPDFTRYIGTSYERWILPVPPVGAICPSSSSETPTDRGRMHESVFEDWSTERTTRFKLELCQGWHTLELPVPICMILDEHPAGDLDINRADDRVEVVGIFHKVCGTGPMRTRPGSPRLVLFRERDIGGMRTSMRRPTTQAGLRRTWEDAAQPEDRDETIFEASPGCQRS
jgi:hypothetical protein